MLNRKAYVLLLSCCWLITLGGLAQEQKVADSLARIYEQNTVTSTAKFELLRELSFNEITDHKKGLRYADELIRLSEQARNNTYLRVGYFLKGTKKRSLGDLGEALDAYYKSADIAKSLNHIKGEGEAYCAIADTYSSAENFSNAFLYYRKAIIALRQVKGDSISLASVLTNGGDAYMKTRKYDSALLYFNEAKIIFDKVNHQSGKAYCLGNIGMVYEKLAKNELAERHLNEAISILEKAQDYYPVCVYLISMANVYSNKGDIATAARYAERSLYLAEQHGLKEQIAEASFKLSELNERAGNITEAFKHYKKHILYRDSINNLKTVQQMATLQTNFEISQKQREVDRANKEKRNLAISFSVILLLTIMLLVTLYWFHKSKNKEKMRLHEQALLSAKLEIQEQTYRTISQELHDNIGQALSLVKINVNTIDFDKPVSAREKLGQSTDLLTKAVQDIRDISKSLNPDFINQIGLAKAIDQQLQLLKRTDLYNTELCIEGDTYDYEPHRELLIFRVVQELLNNIVRHAHADKIVVSMNYENDRLVIKISDNGKGFDIQTQQSLSNQGLGLRNIQNRLKLIKGGIVFESEAKKGTTATVEILK